MFLFGVGVGLVAAFVVMTVAACVGARLVVQVDSERLDSEPLPQLGPSLLLDLAVDPADEQAAKAVSRVHRALEERNKYRSALEAISTMSQDGSSQRIANMALERGWKA
jgi:Lon protease-like protein